MSYNSKVNSKSEENRINERYRPVYSIGLIVLLILVSIAYASLAVTMGVKVNKGEDTVVGGGTEENPPTDPPSTPETPDKPDNPVKPPRPPKPPIIIEDPKPIDKLNWNIEFQNIEEKDGSVTPLLGATIDDTKTGIYYEILLNEPGEYYAFTADIVNTGTMNAKIYNIVESGITARQREFLDYKVTYEDGTKISKNDELLANQSKKVSVLVSFKEDLNAENLPETEQLLELSYRIVYVEK